MFKGPRDELQGVQPLSELTKLHTAFSGLVLAYWILDSEIPMANLPMSRAYPTHFVPTPPRTLCQARAALSSTRTNK